MDDRKPNVTCSCGHAFDIEPAKAFQETACPRCGKVLPAPSATPEPPAAPKTEGLIPKHDTTKGQTPGRPGAPPPTTRRPAIVKDAALPAPIPGYTFLKRLGAGGMGDVFLARQESLDRNVAIKLLPPEFAKDKAYVESFMKEARSAGKVHHENIMGAVDVGESNGRYHFVMEYVAGETLFRVIKQQKAIPEPKALELARQVARGLRHAHQQGLIHRDIKPQNILITPEGTAKICDFGLATELKSHDAKHGEDEENVHTTPAYASPEQCRAEPLDHRTDIYSLGVSLFEMLTGKRPFTAATPRELMTKQVQEQPPVPRSINPAISEAASQLVLKMLKKSKDERFKTYDDLIAALDAALKSPSPKTLRRGGADPNAPLPMPAEPSKKKNLPILIGAAAAGIVLLLVLFLVFRGGKPEAAPLAAGLDPEIQRLLDDMRGLQKSAMGRPGEYPAVRSKWKALEDQFASTPHRSLFAAGRVDFENAINFEAETAAKEVVEDAAAAMKERRPAAALAALKRFPGEYAGTPAASKVAAKTLEIERAIDDGFREELQAIQALASAEKLDEARQKLMNFKAALALDGAELRPQFRTQLDDLLRRLEDQIAAAKKKAESMPTASKDPETLKPGPEPKAPTPGVVAPPLPAVGPALPVSSVPAAALPHYLVLRDPGERMEAPKRAAAAAWFTSVSARSAFLHAAALFLSRDEAAWKLDSKTMAGLQEYLASPELNRPAALTVENHQALLELLVQKCADAGSAPLDALQLFACAHLQELSAKKAKLDSALLLQAKLTKGPISDLWGPAASVGRVEIAAVLLKPPGLWIPRAADIASIAPDFTTRFLGALCTIKDQTFDAASAQDRWRKLGPGGPDPAWIKLCDAVSDRIKAEMTCEHCLGQGRYPCSACNSAGAMICSTCRGTGKVTDPSEGGLVTCGACKGRRAVACAICLGQKGVKCVSCDGKKTRSQLPGSHYRMILDLGLCDLCSGQGSLFTLVGYPCHGCDGNGRSMEKVLQEFVRLPAWSMKGREGRVLYASLRWLARHQSPEGFWGASTWTAACPEPGCRATPAGVMDVGVTSLALSAFLNAGFGPESTTELGNVSSGLVIRRALAWLQAQQGPEGLISHGASIKPVFENHVATWALFSAAQLIVPSEAFTEKDRMQLREVALRALRYGLNTQAKGAGWGYTAGAPSDTWVTSWGAMALLAAKDAGVDIPKIHFSYLLQWMDGVTDKKDFHLGYTPTLMLKVNLPGNDTYQHHDTLSALGGLVRLQIEGKPTATYAAADKFLEKDLPNSEPLRRDYCYWYFGTLYTAFHEQRRGSAWTQWTQALLREQLNLQEATDTCTLGSFPVQERWSAMGGRVYTAAINALSLTQVLGTRPAVAAAKR